MACNLGIERAGRILRAGAGLSQMLDGDRQSLESDARSQQRVAR
jgi:hypothetical protein